MSNTIPHRARVFSGIKPTGTLTLGNYLGAVKNWVASQDQKDNVFCVVNQHAITIKMDPAELRANTRHVAAVYLAAGIDPERAIVFVQSDVHEHTELAWVLNTITYYGELHRMTQFKDKTSKTKEESIGAGLLNYPILMAADILLYDTDEVPVGEDQKQHVELCRDLAIRFNHRYGQTLVVPKPVIPKAGARIMSLEDPSRKMEKSNPSAGSYILLTDTPDAIRKKIRKAVTDSGTEVLYAEDKPALANLLTIYSLMAGEPIPAVQERYVGKGYGDFKKDLAEVVVEGLAPLQARMAEYMETPKILEGILADGAARAHTVARGVMDRVNAAVGLAWG
ncbi:MAG TPA: tryptophan--tRNA ligase [Armatimonadota bacterium]|jgi:tryptophanyl-tRNA synthetase